MLRLWALMLGRTVSSGSFVEDILGDPERRFPHKLAETTHKQCCFDNESGFGRPPSVAASALYSAASHRRARAGAAHPSHARPQVPHVSIR